MKISLIGMASVGKSYWSTKFEAAGFLHLDLDGLIQERLMRQLNRPAAETRFMNDWLNFPDSPGFAEREQLFLDTEANVFEYVLSVLEKADEKTHIVVNTGGSLVYAPPKYWQRLKALTKIVYLKMDKNLSKLLIDNYLQEGRSVIWKGVYAPLSGETRVETYLRCYAKLLEIREGLYEHYADCAVEYPEHRAPTMSIDRFVGMKKTCQAV
jgi:shikimate kinase